MAERRSRKRPSEPPGAAGSAEAADQEIHRLTREQGASRAYLQSVIAEQEAANEEVQSANEALQRINEELETSKEEIQSSNEELATVNDELHLRNLELSQSNDDLSNLLGSVQLPIVMLGPDLRIRRFTAHAERMLHLVSSDVGRPISDLQLNLNVPNLDTLLLEILDTTIPQELEVRDRGGRWYLLRLRPYRTAENKVDGVVMVLIDVEAQKRTQEQLARQAALLDQTLEPIFILETNGDVVYWNVAAETLYGYSAEEVIGRNVHQVLATRQRDGGPRFESVVDRVGQWTGELIHRTADGREIVVESQHNVVVEPDGRRLVMQTNRDVTDRIRLEDKLRREVEELERARRSKDEFLAMLAHELRNPLAALRIGVSLLRTSPPEPEMIERTGEMMEWQIKSMARLVDDLLDVSRITQGKLELRTEVVTLGSLIERAVATIQPVCEAQEQVLQVVLPDEPIHLEADPVRLEQMLGNLLNNACKFTPRGGNVWLTAKRLPGTAANPRGAVLIRVRDDGRGIEAGVLPYVFDMFAQHDRLADRPQSGLGIGLTLVRQLAELHGGRVEAISDGPGQGSEFRVILPVSASGPKAAAGEAGSAASAPFAARRVLVVDDQTDAADGHQALLGQYGHDVRVAYNGPAALDLAAAFRPEVVLLDLGLPGGMDGFELARRLREQPETARSLLVAITGYGNPDDEARARAAGIDHFLVKPADPSQVQALVERGPEPA
jgi:two-component system CheB/CheR fusion protein